MKLFYQLSPLDQEKVLNHCIDLVLDDMINDEIKLDAFTDEEIALKQKIEDAINYVKQFSEKDDKIDYIMNNVEISKAVMEFATEMCKSAYYHEPDEIVFYVDQLDGEKGEQNLLPPASTPKKISNLN